MPTALSALEASLRNPETACPVVLGFPLDSTTATKGVGTPFCPITCRAEETIGAIIAALSEERGFSCILLVFMSITVYGLLLLLAHYCATRVRNLGMP